MKMINPISLAAVASICLAAGFASSAGATPVVYNINLDFSSSGLGTEPFGTVTLNQNGTAVDVTVHLASGYDFVLTGASDPKNPSDFLFNASGVPLGNISITQNASYSSGSQLLAQTGSFSHAGSGDYGFGIYGNGQKNGSAGDFSTDIEFSVANATIADLTQPNSDGVLFAADLYSSATGNTGLAGVSGPPVSAPDGGATALLLGAALTGIGLIRRKLN